VPLDAALLRPSAERIGSEGLYNLHDAADHLEVEDLTPGEVRQLCAGVVGLAPLRRLL
jgi:hypothetical protein